MLKYSKVYWFSRYFVIYPKVVTLIIQLLFGMIIIGLPLAFHFKALENKEYWERIGLIVFLSAFALMAVLAILPIGYSNKGYFATFVR